MIKATNLIKYYGQKLAINGIHFELKKGEIVGLLGLNGSGKTTTLRILTGFLIPTEGEVTINGISNFNDPIEAKKHIGYLPETPPLYEDMTVESYLLHVSRLKGIAEDKLKAEIDRVVQKTALTEERDNFLGNLSLGYRKRAGIAQALLGAPPVIIMDEPISGLDPKQIMEMRKLIRSLAGEHTVLISSHILSELQKTCDRFLFLHDGKIQFNYNKEELDRELQKLALLEVNLTGKSVVEMRNFVKSLDKDIQIRSEEEEMDGITFSLKSTNEVQCREKLLDSFKEKGLKLQYLKKQEVTLEQIFLTSF
ncbi:MAG: ABC transporter ATP-binding protein [Leptospiraceae bacterium]|nr:ABC transporter ATP-binding protein [Leptospiraceae bacterium]MCP5510679.1 ABC transporter ATP-binding protein [Leptospiraceae bacterium]